MRAIIWCAVSTAAQANEDEKFSLTAQEADARALCEREGWQIVDTMIVPGHSRDYKSLDKLAADAAAKGIHAFYGLIDHLNNCDFDIFICRDANRFARRASLLHYIVESIIDDCGARIYSLTDGWVDSTNADIFAMVKGYETRKQMKWLKESATRGKDKLIDNGLPTGPWVVMSHKRVRDPVSGKDVAIVLNEVHAQLWKDLATLILEGVGWGRLGFELFRRFGYVDETGQPYSSGRMYSVVTNPMFWGHSARRMSKKPFGPWIFDDSTPPPDGVYIRYHCLPPVYTGELAEQIKTELKRRMILAGRAKPSTSYRFTGLFLCGECGRMLCVVTRKDGTRKGLRCFSIFGRNRTTFDCTQNRTLPTSIMQAYIHDLLVRLLSGEINAILEAADTNAATQLYETLARELQALEQSLTRMIHEQSLAPEVAQNYYREQIRVLAERLTTLKERADAVRREAMREQRDTQIQQAALDRIREITLEAFWELPDREINQHLHRLMGKRRFIVVNREIVAIGEKLR